MSKKITKVEFPKSFLWGTSIAGAQVENSRKEDGKSESIWDHWFKNERYRFYEGNFVKNDFNLHYKEDLKLAKELNMTIFRTSIQWTRLMPDGKNINKKAVLYYNDLFDEIRKNGMEPVVCLFHYDMPLWLQEKGGWENNDSPKLFAKYAKTAFELFSKKVKMWTTHNEPIVVSENGYMFNTHYPNVVSMKRAMHVQVNILKSHFEAVNIFNKEFKTKDKNLKIGIVLNINPAYPRSNSPEDVRAAEMSDLLQWKCYLDPAVKGEYPSDLINTLKKHNLWGNWITAKDKEFFKNKNSRMDFLGVNYYLPNRAKALDYKPNFDQSTVTFHHFYENYSLPNKRFNPDRGWEIYPKGLYDILKFLEKDYGNIPCFITENGIGTMNEDRFRNKNGMIEDNQRIDFIGEHLYWVSKAVKEGSNCKGYLLWSYIDNWSWSNTYKNRYGVIELDLKTGKRIKKKSFAWLQKVYKDGKFEIEKEIY